MENLSKESLILIRHFGNKKRIRVWIPNFQDSHPYTCFENSPYYSAAAEGKETGVAMLSSVLKSPAAIEMNISIMRNFVALRKVASNYQEIMQILTGPVPGLRSCCRGGRREIDFSEKILYFRR